MAKEKGKAKWKQVDGLTRRVSECQTDREEDINNDNDNNTTTTTACVWRKEIKSRDSVSVSGVGFVCSSTQRLNSVDAGRVKDQRGRHLRIALQRDTKSETRKVDRH